MTLKEKFYKEFISKPDLYPLEECEKIANDFAIEFAEWIAINDYRCYSNGWGKLWVKGTLTPKELLEIYKKEKGL